MLREPGSIPLRRYHRPARIRELGSGFDVGDCMFVVVTFFEAKREHRDEIRAALLAHGKTTLERELGCRRFDVSADPVDASAFLLYEIYDDEAAFTAHREMPHYAEFAITVEPWTAAKRILTYSLLAGRPGG
jgi:autoinducer 2-degrading protein